MQDNIYNIIRPTSFQDIFEHGNHIRSLKTMITEKSLPHSILIAGASGTGKTTLANIIAKALNCEAKIRPCNKCSSCLSPESYVTWIHAGDDRGIDPMREIARQAELRPLAANIGVTLIDEAGGLTKDAQRVLREVLENPPAHRYMILITSEKEKIQTDIRNRCLNIDIASMTDLESTDFIAYILDRLKDKLGIDRKLTDDEVGKLIDFPDRNSRDLINRTYSYITTGIMPSSDKEVPANIVSLFHDILYANKTWPALQMQVRDMNVQYAEAKAFMCNLASKNIYTSKDRELVTRASIFLDLMLPPLELANPKADIVNRLFKAWRACYQVKKT